MTNVTFSANGPVLPYDGLTFAHEPPRTLAVLTSTVETVSTQTVAPAALNQKMVGFGIEAYGLTSYLPVSESGGEHRGTTNTGDISNLKVFFTGSSNGFSTATQFGYYL